MNPTFTLAIVLVAAQQPTAPIPSASQPVATPLQAQSRPATLLPIDEGFVTSMVYSPDGKTLAAGYARAPTPPAAWCCGTWPDVSAWSISPSP